ncbi:hypothetical protein RHGRI_033734 [Rhododendron griersonianum]|uniref:MADS-box domain-containing protein n=1 Tax=Rhododendron griersonianum TaxID=479676 RepID=A0AAV6I298_9ERIC|nr:hypothetical protein RHGRI_033734 [Rhododendron griersonianum]
MSHSPGGTCAVPDGTWVRATVPSLSLSVSTSWILFQKMLGFWLYATFLALPELKGIEDKNRRQFSSSKRRSGLMKKASELSVLCDVNIGFFIFSGRSRLHEFCSGDRQEAYPYIRHLMLVVRVVSAVIMAIRKAVPLGLASRACCIGFLYKSKTISSSIFGDLEPWSWVLLSFKLVRDNLTGEKEMLEQAEETPKALDLNKDSEMAKRCFRFDTICATSVRRFGDGGIFIGNLRKPVKKSYPNWRKNYQKQWVGRIFVKEKVHNGKKANRIKTKEPRVDSELIYPYAKIDRLGEVEEFILMPNVANLPNVGDRLYDEGLYEAAKIILAFISNWAKLASTLVKLKKFQGAVDAARKANSSKTWKEVCFAFVDAEEFCLAQICGLNIIIQYDEFDNAATTIMNHSPGAWDHMQFKDVAVKVAYFELYYKAVHFYLEEHPDLINVICLTCLHFAWTIHLCLILQTYVALFEQIEKHELLEMKRVAAYIYKKAGMNLDADSLVTVAACVEAPLLLMANLGSTINISYHICKDIVLLYCHIFPFIDYFVGDSTWTVYTAQQSLHLILLKGEVTGRVYNVAGSIDRLWQWFSLSFWFGIEMDKVYNCSQNKGNCSDVISIVNCCSQKRSKDFTRSGWWWSTGDDSNIVVESRRRSRV